MGPFEASAFVKKIEMKIVNLASARPPGSVFQADRRGLHSVETVGLIQILAVLTAFATLKYPKEGYEEVYSLGASGKAKTVFASVSW